MKVLVPSALRSYTGERSAVDGSVIEGLSKIDQSLITGETLPVKAGPGTAVYAGTLNLSGALRVRVSAASEGTLLAEISRLLDNAVLDYDTNLVSKGFFFQNPNAKSTCGCGTSFST